MTSTDTSRRIVDTSMTGYVSGSLQREDDIYRNRKRPQPYPIPQVDSGYESAVRSQSISVNNLPVASLLHLATSLKCDELLNNDANFAAKTAIEGYHYDGVAIKHHILDEAGFANCIQSSGASQDNEPKHQSLIFIAPLEFETDATYKARTSFSKGAVKTLLSTMHLSPLFVPDLLGRPNYWSPELYSTSDSVGIHGHIEFFCQYPRFAIHSPNFKQRSPVSIYMRHDVATNLTYYIISGPESEDCIISFKNLLNLACNQDGGGKLGLLDHHPLEVHILLCKISCESSHGFIHTFRQSMFAQLRAVDELSAQETANRKGLADVTIELQIISKDVNKLISDVDVACRNLSKIQDALLRLDKQRASVNGANAVAVRPSHHHHRQHLADTLHYLSTSMDKQKMWLHNYRDRKDIAMSLVFNLVTQQDAANNITIAKDMRRDSSSMNGIALLTMVFLPGTFTSTILGAGLYSAVAQSKSIHVTNMWWFWAAITFPLTGTVLVLWFMFCWRQEIRQWITHLMALKRSQKPLDVEAKGC